MTNTLRCLALLFAVAALAGCDDVVIDDGRGCPDDTCSAASALPPWVETIPPVDLPAVLRQANYGGGSCMHAALISVLRWQGYTELAERWRRSHGGAAGVWDLARLADRHQLDYAWTTSGDARFLEWCSETRRGAAIHFKPVHACAFFGYVVRNGVRYAVVCDNNDPDTLEYVEAERFLTQWRSYGGLALTVVGTPANPRPWL